MDSLGCAWGLPASRRTQPCGVVRTDPAKKLIRNYPCRPIHNRNTHHETLFGRSPGKIPPPCDCVTCSRHDRHPQLLVLSRVPGRRECVLMMVSATVAYSHALENSLSAKDSASPVICLSRRTSSASMPSSLLILSGVQWCFVSAVTSLALSST